MLHLHPTTRAPNRVTGLSLLCICAALLVQSVPAFASSILFIANYGSSTASPLAYNIASQSLTTIDSKLHISGAVVTYDPSSPNQLDLFAPAGNSGFTTLYTYSINSGPTYGAANAFVSNIPGESRGMAYSPLNNSIYLTTDFGGNGSVRQITASGPNAGTYTTPITFATSRVFGAAVDSSGILWLANFPNGLYRYDPSAPSPTPQLALAASGGFSGLYARDTIAPSSFAGGAYANDIFITDLTGNRVIIYDPVTLTGSILANTGTNLLNGPAGIGFDPFDGSLYVTNSGNSTVVRYNVGTSTFQYVTGLGPGNSVLNGPNDLSFSPVPEPASLAGVVIIGAAISRRRRNRGS